MPPVFRPIPDLRRRVWGGTRLGGTRLGWTPTGEGRDRADRRIDGGADADAELPIGEAWIAGPTSQVDVEGQGRLKLDELAERLGRALVGSAAPRADRFPLLVKLIDTAAWLSVQVHPDDETARRLEGPDGVGKSEAWYVLDAEPGARILLGVQPGVADEAVRAAIAAGRVAKLLIDVEPAPGDSVSVPAGTLHAIGPGMFVCEVQQPSDLTYRVEDWGRPASAARALHTAQALAAWKPALGGSVIRAADGVRSLVVDDHFVLERLEPGATVTPGGETPHVILALPESDALIRGDGWSERLGPLETLIVAASGGPWTLEAGSTGHAACLLARLPGGGG